jgi:predicted Na+-dependent transporter
MNEKTIVSTVALATSLATYFYAKEAQKDVVPYMLVGGFLGAILGEAIAGMVQGNKDKDKTNKNEKP